MSIINYFSNKKYKIFRKNTEIDPTSGASISKWDLAGEISGYFTPENSDTLVGSAVGNKYDINGVFYTHSKISLSDRILVEDIVYEVRETEFWQLPYISYYKGYLVKTDEDVRI